MSDRIFNIYLLSGKIGTYLVYLFYGLTSLIFSLALGYIFANNKWRNLTLVSFALSVLITSVTICASRVVGIEPT
jgi:hypothetical protein